MYRNRFLLTLFISTVLLIPIFYGFSTVLAGAVTILSILFLIIFMIQYLSSYEKKIQRGFRIEFFTSFRHHILKGYMKPRDIWVVYDKFKKRFRSADLRDFPINIGVIGLFGIILIYMAYLIMSAIPVSPLFLLFRMFSAFALGVVGFYNFFVAADRMLSIQSTKSERLSQKLNRMRSLRNFVSRKENKVEITPNFLLPDGFITSVEILSKKTINRKKMERVLTDVSRNIKRIR